MPLVYISDSHDLMKGVVMDYTPNKGNPVTTFVKDKEKATLNKMQKAVGGYVEVIRLNPKQRMIINEEGKILGLRPNAQATKLFRESFPGTMDYIAGDAVILEGKARFSW